MRYRVQEKKIAFSMRDLDKLISLCKKGIDEIIQLQKHELGDEITKLIDSSKDKPVFLVGTTNAHKLDEIRAILEKQGILVKSPADFSLENN